MAQKVKKPFNLLYKIEAQKSFVDRLYEFVIGPARLIVVFVMFLILATFAYRLVLDTNKSDQKKQAEINLRKLQNTLDGQESEFRELAERTLAAKKYTKVYKDVSATEATGYYPMAATLDRLMTVSAKYPSDIIITDYNFTNLESPTKIKVSGQATTFSKVDDFVKDLRLVDIVADASSVNQTSQRGQNPKFVVDIILKD
jgi:Tfp pilus assembly protein PilN